MQILLPDYPETAPLQLKHKQLLDEHHQKLNWSYAATNFTNLFILDTDNSTTLSRLEHLDLIQRGEPNGVTSVFIIGTIDDEAQLSLHRHGIIHIDQYPYKIGTFSEDVDNAEYFYQATKIRELEGSNFAGIRRKINQFNKTTNGTWSFGSSQNVAELSELTREWELTNGQVEEPTRIEESRALEKTWLFYDRLNVQTVVLRAKDKVAGFAVLETVPDDTCIIHFFKSDHSIPGAAEMLFQQIAQTCAQTFINFEQDLGMPGLRRFKQSLRPHTIRPVYTITLDH